MKSKKLIIGFITLMIAFVLSACAGNNENKTAPNNNADTKNEANKNMDMSKEGSNSMEGMDQSKMEGHMSHNKVVSLNNSTGENELKMPPVLKSDNKKEVIYTVRAQKGETEIFDGTKTKTYGYNGSFLGPVLRLNKGDTVKIRLINELDEGTTFHWHGLEVPGKVDGGPHASLKPGEEKSIKFKVTQEASTLWFHPHPMGTTAEQVYKGLAGLIYIEDDNSKSLGLPNEYGKNDIPLIFQDKKFDDKKQLNYKAARNEDGTIGDTLLINGTLNPKLTVKKEKVRLRLLNGSNARNYTFKLNTGDSFVQVATDGGFLNKPVTLKEITLTPSERAEIVVDFSKLNTEKDLALINEDGSILLPFKVSDQSGEDSSIPGKMNNFSITEKERNLPVTKKVEFFGMMKMVTINGKKFDPERIDFTQKQGVTEVWEFYNKPDAMGGMIHPVHIHGTQFKIISRNGEEPPENERGWKDSFSLKPDETVKIAVQFKHKGVYMIHCHILEHEDNGMMAQIKVE
ncbi:MULTISPECIES: multicopper oxidase family protein [Heyndrickxia]|jgi:blue copper oxidase|uniref:multicopper oxidase family protein n=1 Tax=Heyndrickxia TaxID=2837504 RepID=UPI002DB9DC9B|nr:MULTISPECIES: multicopper oxidase domain-containing protein [Heyndrickxia]MEC2305290.1 multicopper oxidase domain-containing protein [Weizmannia sp. CD-2023]MEC2342093.1 multicopper oxidase domain-containing protein [Weizmannia sp. CD-2023]MED4407110.1 multicopper oxidase domain-containing protein [Heyndrickxia coagulans]MED4942569.1 multicopper oxidase domain-containing protein [Heyndrickxia coagulans]MED4964060.1 multicopper oxidase domain-containing protein [Heyndrickxia coagulans]